MRGDAWRSEPAEAFFSSEGRGLLSGEDAKDIRDNTHFIPEGRGVILQRNAKDRAWNANDIRLVRIVAPRAAFWRDFLALLAQLFKPWQSLCSAD